MPDAPKDRLPVRCLNGRWQVLVYSPETWINFDTQTDAELVAEGDALQKQVVAGLATGKDVAARLDAAAISLTGAFGGDSMAARNFRLAADLARGELA